MIWIEVKFFFLRLKKNFHFKYFNITENFNGNDDSEINEIFRRQSCISNFTIDNNRKENFCKFLKVESRENIIFKSCSFPNSVQSLEYSNLLVQNNINNINITQKELNLILPEEKSDQENLNLLSTINSKLSLNFGNLNESYIKIQSLENTINKSAENEFYLEIDNLNSNNNNFSRNKIKVLSLNNSFDNYYIKTNNFNEINKLKIIQDSPKESIKKFRSIYIKDRATVFTDKYKKVTSFETEKYKSKKNTNRSVSPIDSKFNLKLEEKLIIKNCISNNNIKVDNLKEIILNTNITTDINLDINSSGKNSEENPNKGEENSLKNSDLLKNTENKKENFEIKTISSYNINESIENYQEEIECLVKVSWLSMFVVEVCFFP